MLSVDTNTMLIAITRGDTATLIFSAETSAGVAYTPEIGDILKFAVSKKPGTEELMSIENVYDGSADWWNIKIKETDWDKLEKPGDYFWDCQIDMGTDVETIIGITDSIIPIFRVWGEVAQNE